MNQPQDDMETRRLEPRPSARKEQDSVPDTKPAPPPPMPAADDDQSTVTPAARKKIAEYEVIRPLGEGGMGMVYLAMDPALHRNVAIKVVRGELFENPDFQRRFLREARLSAALNHPNIVTVYRVGEDAGYTFLVMEYVNGKSLKDLLRTPPPMSLRKVLEITMQCVAGLEAAARQGIVHRDFKPANVMMRSEDGLVKLMDFGLSRRVGGETGTMTSSVMGTPDYMSPEQAAGRDSDFRTDVYALGITIYQCVTGTLPYKSTSVFETIRRHAQEPLPDSPFLKSVADGRLWSLIQWMTAKTPEERPTSYALIRAELQGIVEKLGADGDRTNQDASPLDADQLRAVFQPTVKFPAQRDNRSSSQRIPLQTQKHAKRSRTPLMAFGGVLLLLGGLAGAYYAGLMDMAKAGPGGQTVTPSPAPPPPATPSGTSAATPVVGNSPAASRIKPIGQFTWTSPRTGASSAADLLHGLGTQGLSIFPSRDLRAEQIPICASFANRKADEVLQVLATALCWNRQQTPQGVVQLVKGDPWPPDLVKFRSADSVSNLPVVTINTLGQTINIRLFLDGLQRDHGLDYLIVGAPIAAAPMPSVSLSQQPLPTVLGVVSSQSVAFDWGVINDTLVLIPAMRVP